MSQSDVAPSNQEKYGGIYLGEEVIADGFSIDKDPFSYSVEVYGREDNKKKNKKGRMPISGESRHFQDVAAMSHREPESKIKEKHFDIDSRGLMYEKDNDGLLAGLDRLNHNTTKPFSSSLDMSGIYFGDEEPAAPTPLPIEEPSPSSFSAHHKGETFEEFLPFLSGKNRDQFVMPPSYHSPTSMTSQLGKTKEMHDDHGIYLGLFFIFIVTDWFKHSKILVIWDPHGRTQQLCYFKNFSCFKIGFY